MAVVNKLARARKLWSRMSRIHSREGEAPQVSRLFFKAVVQAVLLFVAETWVITSRMSKALGGGQTQVEIRLTGRIPRWKPDGRCRYTPAEAAREEVGFL